MFSVCQSYTPDGAEELQNTSRGTVVTAGNDVCHVICAPEKVKELTVGGARALLNARIVIDKDGQATVITINDKTLVTWQYDFY